MSIESVTDGESFKRAAMELLQGAKTVEEVNAVEALLMEHREKVFTLDPSFKREVEENTKRIKLAKMQEAAEYKLKEQEIRARATNEESSALADTLKFSVQAPPPFVEEPKMLFCPICGASISEAKANRVDGKPACFKCMHEMVPKDELSKFNRSYRRRFRVSRGLGKT